MVQTVDRKILLIEDDVENISPTQMVIETPTHLIEPLSPLNHYYGGGFGVKDSDDNIHRFAKFDEVNFVKEIYMTLPNKSIIIDGEYKNYALSEGVVGNSCVCIGNYAGVGTSGIPAIDNIYIGTEAGRGISGGSFRVLIGKYSGKNIEDQTSRQVGIGYKSLMESTGSEQTVAIGFESALECKSSLSTYIGSEAGSYSFGEHNIAIGYQAGLGLSGLDNICIGYGAGNNMVGDNNILIGTGATTSASINNISYTNNGSLIFNSNGRNLMVGDFATGRVNILKTINLTPTTPPAIAYKGDIIYNTSDVVNKPQYFDGGSWKDFGGGGVGPVTQNAIPIGDGSGGIVDSGLNITDDHGALILKTVGDKNIIFADTSVETWFELREGLKRIGLQGKNIDGTFSNLYLGNNECFLRYGDTELRLGSVSAGVNTTFTHSDGVEPNHSATKGQMDNIKTTVSYESPLDIYTHGWIRVAKIGLTTSWRDGICASMEIMGSGRPIVCKFDVLVSANRENSSDPVIPTIKIANLNFIKDKVVGHIDPTITMKIRVLVSGNEAYIEYYLVSYSNWQRNCRTTIESPVGSFGGTYISLLKVPTVTTDTTGFAVTEYNEDDQSATLKQVRENGTTTSRPTEADRTIGKFYFDTTLGKPIWWDGSVWKDANGTTV